MVVFEMAGAYDFAGREADALPHYQRALSLGLPDEQMKYLYVQMGSTQRNLRLYAEAVQTLREGIARFPDYRPLRAFLALALHSAGQTGDALAEMLELTLNTPDFYPEYNRALGYYAGELRGR
jgi:tetratricopeptide (TPR) repeat protein